MVLAGQVVSLVLMVFHAVLEGQLVVFRGVGSTSCGAGRVASDVVCVAGWYQGCWCQSYWGCSMWVFAFHIRIMLVTVT